MNLKRNEWGEPEYQSDSMRDRIASILPVSYSGIILLLCIAIFFLGSIIPGLDWINHPRPGQLPGPSY